MRPRTLRSIDRRAYWRLKQRELRSRNPERYDELRRLYRESHRPEQQELNRKYWIEHKDKLSLRDKKYKLENREKKLAHYAVGNAVKAGTLIKQPCRECGEKKVQAHHEDYSRPLDVIWLCASHHRKLHLLQKSPLEGRAFD